MNSPLFLGLTGLSYAIPTIVLTLVGGVIADRTDKEAHYDLDPGCHRAFASFLALLIMTGRVRLWHVIFLPFLGLRAGV